MFSRFLITLMGAFLAVSAMSAWSAENTELEEILVLSGSQDLGDSPKPTIVEYLVDLQEEQLARANYAALEFRAAHVCCGSWVTVNGRQYTLPWSEDKNIGLIDRYANTAIPIPVGSLLLKNAITFEAFRFGFSGQTNSYDDYRIADVYLVLSLAGTEGDGDAQQVDIDFKPNDKRNIINPRSMGRVWVAILSAPDFDAQQVDPMTVALGAGSAVPDKYVSKYSNRDGMLDLVLRFKTPEIGLQCGDTDVTLTGETYTGGDITGIDSLVTVGCK
jgi:hypothetical protein